MPNIPTLLIQLELRGVCVNDTTKTTLAKLITSKFGATLDFYFSHVENNSKQFIAFNDTHFITLSDITDKSCTGSIRDAGAEPEHELDHILKVSDLFKTYKRWTNFRIYERF